MTASNFPQSIAYVLASEGGYSNNAADPGGPTSMGITLATLRAYRGRATSAADVRALTKTEAGEIYKANFWAKVCADQLPPGVDYCTFDFAVNSGPGTAAKFLQRCLSVTDDGQIGGLTLKAAYQVRPADLINSLCDKRLAYLRALGTWSTFGKGWASRIVFVRANALRMAANPIPQPQVSDQPVIPTGPMPKLVPLPPKQPDDPGPAKPASSNWLVKLIAAIVAAIFPKT